MLSSVAQYCAQNGNLRFCVSNPCFELWLLLHIEDIATYDRDQMLTLSMNKKVNAQDTWLKKHIRDLIGIYHESEYDPMAFLPTIDKAIIRAEKLDGSPKDRWPQSVGTRVYLLAQSIMNVSKIK